MFRCVETSSFLQFWINSSSFLNAIFLNPDSLKWQYSAYKAKYIEGYEDNTFKPDNPITRAEAVKIINSVLDRNDYRNEKNPFGDVSQNHWAYKQILEAAIEHTK